MAQAGNVAYMLHTAAYRCIHVQGRKASLHRTSGHQPHCKTHCSFVTLPCKRAKAPPPTCDAMAAACCERKVAKKQVEGRSDSTESRSAAMSACRVQGCGGGGRCGEAS